MKMANEMTNSKKMTSSRRDTVSGRLADVDDFEVDVLGPPWIPNYPLTPENQLDFWALSYTVNFEPVESPEKGNVKEERPKEVEKEDHQKCGEGSSKLGSNKKIDKFHVFFEENRTICMRENPEKSGREITKILRKMWNKLAEHEKKEYAKKARNLEKSNK